MPRDECDEPNPRAIPRWLRRPLFWMAGLFLLWFCVATTMAALLRLTDADPSDVPQVMPKPE